MSARRLPKRLLKPYTKGDADLQAISKQLTSREATLSAVIEAARTKLAQLSTNHDTARADPGRLAEYGGNRVEAAALQ